MLLSKSHSLPSGVTMITRIAFCILPVLIIWSLVAIEGLPSTEDSRKNLLRQDDLLINCCRSLRITDPSNNCMSCEDQFKAMDPVTEDSGDVPKTPLGVPCSLTHRGCIGKQIA
ncbi:uncharacterized protein LOC120454658 [Drosophila santomea]|uniref:uncharacterized protein LOC120454658 n=1 Tax=Drosophila santomea TaxID=129105 RepID=UPI001954C232|nr:uncharacterized protein LOC120454658 [Drosophila santomea]